MSIEKRFRGRPLGEGKKDSPYLAQVADVLINDPSLKATTAMKRVMRGWKGSETRETLLRRWQVKWKRGRDAFLTAARERARPKPMASAASYYPGTATQHLKCHFDEVFRVQREMERALGSDWQRTLQRQADEFFRTQRQLEQALGTDISALC